MAIVGYQRVSSTGQKLDRQDLGDVDKLFVERVSGKDRNRPEWQACDAYLRPGDTLRVHSADRLARSLSDLLHIVDGLTGRGVRVEFMKEGMVFDPGADNPYDRCLMSVMGAFAELERNLIRARQAEGIALAKARGIYEGKGRHAALKPDDVRRARLRHGDGVTLARLTADYGVAKGTMRAALAGTGIYAGESYR